MDFGGADYYKGKEFFDHCFVRRGFDGEHAPKVGLLGEHQLFVCFSSIQSTENHYHILQHLPVL
jgi:hypothetical protein